MLGLHGHTLEFVMYRQPFWTCHIPIYHRTSWCVAGLGSFSTPPHPLDVHLCPSIFSLFLYPCFPIFSINLISASLPVSFLLSLYPSLGMPRYIGVLRENVTSGHALLALANSDLERRLGIAHPLHRRRLRLCIEEERTSNFKLVVKGEGGKGKGEWDKETK